MNDWLTKYGRLGIRGRRSELSVPWNRQQADSLAQVFIEAGPRYQTNKAPVFPREISAPSDRSRINATLSLLIITPGLVGADRWSELISMQEPWPSNSGVHHSAGHGIPFLRDFSCYAQLRLVGNEQASRLRVKENRSCECRDTFLFIHAEHSDK